MPGSTSQVQVITLISLIVFAAAMVVIGINSRKQAQSMEGFLLGGRKIGAWMSAFAYGTTYFSAVIFIGYAGKHGWDIGFASIWIGVGNAVLGCLAAWLLLAKRTRTMTHRLDAKTMPEYFAARYGSKNMKLFAAVIIFVFLVPYSAAVYKGLGSLFNTIFPDVSVNVCMLIIAVLTAFFLFMGGYVASVHTDFLLGIIMIIGVVIMVIIVTLSPQVNGLSNAVKSLKAIEPSLVDLTGGSNLRFLVTNIMLTSFGTWGLPQMINKYYAVKDKSAIKRATVISTLFAALISVGAYYTGSLGRLILNNTLPEGGYDSVVPQLLLKALGDSNVFTTIVLAVILVLLLSASMSTLSAIVLTSSSAISVDLLPELKPGLKQKSQMIIMRGLCLAFVALSFIFATYKISIIVNIMSFSWGIVSGCFIGPYIWGLYSKRITKAGAWAGMLGAFCTILGLTVFNSISQSFAYASSNAPFYGVLAMCVSAVLTPIVSLFTAKPAADIIEKAFE